MPLWLFAIPPSGLLHQIATKLMKLQVFKELVMNRMQILIFLLIEYYLASSLGLVKYRCFTLSKVSNLEDMRVAIGVCNIQLFTILIEL